MVVTLDSSYPSQTDASAPLPATSIEAVREPTWRRLTRENPGMVVGVVLSAVGAVIVILGWYGAAHTTVLQYQVPYVISGGMLGSALVVLGGIYTATANIRQHQDRLEALLHEAMYGATGEDAGSAPQVSEPSTGELFTVPGGTTYHRGSCAVLRGKAPEVVDPVADRSLTPCRICRP